MRHKKLQFIFAIMLLIVIFQGNSQELKSGLEEEINIQNRSCLEHTPLSYESHKDGRNQQKEDNIKQQTTDGIQRGIVDLCFPTFSQPSTKISSISSVVSYVSHNTIYIDDNTDFGPLGYNFTGTGTYHDPYRIHGYDITNSSVTLIYIRDTTVYFRIYDNHLNAITRVNNGIVFHNVTRGTIYNNTIHNCFWGSRIEISKNNSIYGNYFYDNSLDGFCIYLSSNNNISSNIVYQNDRNGIQVETSCEKLTIFNNTVFNNNNTGIHIDSSDNNTIILNFAYDNGQSGIQLSASTSSARNNTISGNTLFSNSQRGFTSVNCPNNTISDNFMYNNTWQGIGIFSASHSNKIVNNTVFSHNGSGIFVIQSNNVKIFNNTAFNNGYNAYLNTSNMASGISLYMLSDALVFNNTSYDSYDIGFGVWNVQNTILLNNIVHGNIDDGIEVSDTSFNITISNNTIFNNNDNGIYVLNSHNNSITKNNVNSNSQDGIFFEDSNYNTIYDNDIFCNGNSSVCPSVFGSNQLRMSIQRIAGGGNGIFLDPSNYNNISHNRIFNNSQDGIGLENSGHNIIELNDIYGNGAKYGGAPQSISDISYSIQRIAGGGNGIFLDPSNYNTISNNEIHNNSGDGIRIENSSYNLIWGNIIYNNGGTNGGSPRGISDIRFSFQRVAGGGNGIFLDPCYYHEISNNTIFNNRNNGIYLFESYDISIYANIVFYNGLYGIFIDTGSLENTVSWNDFIGNNLEGTSQAYYESSNTFIYNYWDEWTSPDVEPKDGYVDNPYPIDGELDNYDPYPAASPQNSRTLDIHFISRPRIYYPNGGETVDGTITVEWSKAIDSWDHSLSYTLYYSANGGDTWNWIAEGLSTLRHDWNTEEVSDGSNYLIKIVAICDKGLEVEDVSDASFTIQNGPPPTTTTSTTKSTKSTGETTTPTVTSGPSWILLFSSVVIVVAIERRKKRKSGK
ncbi:MAG: right-handed parallel beta-helix repeat-containing protein [Promethearchaeota archaeon]